MRPIGTDMEAHLRTAQRGRKFNPRGSPRLCLLFIDGLGVGEKVPDWNPLARDGFELLSVFAEDLPYKSMPFGGLATGLDAALGVEGIPQSATGQTALFTGVNAPRLLGRHLPGFPSRQLRRLIFERSLLRIARRNGLTAAFVNAYTRLVDELPFERLVRRVSATTMMCLSAGQSLFDVDDIRFGRALYQDYSNRVLRERGHDLPELSPEKAGEILARISAEYDLCVYEYFRTDRAGHRGDPGEVQRVLEGLERLVRSLLDNLDLETTAVLAVSDHGNVEDLRVDTHTRNPALAAAWGLRAADLIHSMRELTDVYGSVLHLLGVDGADSSHERGGAAQGKASD